jgi:hypothetical protein
VFRVPETPSNRANRDLQVLILTPELASALVPHSQTPDARRLTLQEMALGFCVGTYVVHHVVSCGVSFVVC